MSKKTKAKQVVPTTARFDKAADAAMKNTLARLSAPHASHDVRKGVCVVCGRTGADLVPACPGYRTAADIQRRTK